MRSISYFALAATAAFALAACGDDDPVNNATSATVQLSIAGNMGAQGELELESRTYGSTAVAEGFRMSRLSYYLSEVALVEEANGQDLRTDVAEVAYVQFGPDGTAALDFDNVPVGSYDKLRFRLGLTAEQDATVPNDYAASSPLGRDSEYWFDWGSYIFMKVEGRSDTLADGTERFDVPFVYHVGRAAMLGRDIEIDYPLDIESGGATVALEFNVAQLLGLGDPSGVRLAGGIDHANMEAVPIMNRAAEAFTRAQ